MAGRNKGIPTSKHAAAVLLWTLIWALFFATLILGVERLPNSDLSGQFHAFGAFQAREITSGRLPVWSPGSYSGVPFAADTQAAVFYPPRYLTILFTVPDGFSFYGLEMEGLLHIWLAGVFTYFLAFDIARNLQKSGRNGRGFAPAQWAGLTAAAAFGVGGYLTSYPLLQLAVLETVAWLPLILFLLRRAASAQVGMKGETRSPMPALMVAAVALGISALAGHPQSFLQVAYMAAAYYLFQAWQRRWRWSWTLGLGVVVAVVALGVAMPAYLPAARALQLTVRGDVGYEFVSRGFPLLDMLQIMLPGPYSFWLPQYSGLVTVVLAALAWFGRKSLPAGRRRAENLFWFGVLLAAAWLSLGDKGVLFELAYRAAPGFALFRQQERWISLVVLSLALLAAQGLVLWFSAGVAERKRWLRKSAAILAAVLLLAGVIFLLSRTAVGENDWPAIWVRQWLLLAAILAVLWPWGGNPTAGRDQRRAALLLALLCLDLFLPVRRGMDLQRESPSVFWPQPDWIENLRGEGLSRIDGQNLFHANIGEIYGLEDVKGISPLKPGYAERFEELPRPLRWRLLNVRHVLAHEALEEGLLQTEIIDEGLMPGENAQAAVYRYDEALPRAWMVYDVISAGSDDEAFDLLKQPDFDPGKQAVVTSTDRAALQELRAPGKPPRVAIERVSPSQLKFEINTDTEGILVISEWALPGWQASLDGAAAAMQTVDYALQGVFVPAGEHSLLLTYVARDVQAGIVVALLTLVAAGLAAWRWRPYPSLRPESVQRARIEDKPEWPAEAERPTIAAAHWIMAGVVLLAFALRIFLIGNQELRGDEAFSYLATLLPFRDVVPSLVSQGDPHSPLHYLLLNGWVDLAGDSELALRWLSLVPGVLLVALLYQLGRKMAGRDTGILAAGLTAASPLLIWLAQDVRNQYTLALFFSALATWLLVRIAETTSARSRGRTAAAWALYAVAAALAVFSHFYTVFALISHGLYLWFSPQRRRLLGGWALSGLLAFLLFLPWFNAALGGVLAAGQLSDPDSPELARYLAAAGQELLVGSTVNGSWPRWLALALSAVALGGFLGLGLKRRAWAAMLLGWVGGVLLFIFLIRFSRSTFNTFYVSIAAPAWLLLLAAGIQLGWRRGGWRRIGAAAGLAALLLSSAVSLRNYYFDPAFSRTLGFRAVAELLKTEAHPDDLFLAHFPDPALDYYLRDTAVTRQMLPARSGQPAGEVRAALAEALDTYGRLWFVPYDRSVWDPDNVVPGWLEDNTVKEFALQRGRLILNAYRSLSGAEPLLYALDENVGEEVILESVLIGADGAPLDAAQTVSLGPGSPVDVTLIWSAVEDGTRNYTVFVHLLDENGVLLAQHDGIPAEGRRPTALWESGEIIIDKHQLSVPEGASGSGRLIAGIYDSDTLVRQRFESGQETVLLAAVRFE